MTKAETVTVDELVAAGAHRGRPKDPVYSVFMDVPVERVARLAQDLVKNGQQGRNSVMVLVEHNVAGKKSREDAIDYVREGLREDERYGTFVVALSGALQWVVREDPDAELRASIIAEFRQALGDIGEDELHAMADRAIKASRNNA